MNTFSNYIEVGIDAEGHKIQHRPHEYTDLLENIFRLDFLHSVEYKKFQEENNNRTIGLSTFVKGATRCPCIKRPTLRACVDEVEVNVAESLNALRLLMRTNDMKKCTCAFCVKHAKDKKEMGRSFVSPFTSTFAALDHLILCEKMQFPNKDNLIDEKIFRKECCYENCAACAAHSESAECLLNCPTMFDESRTITWKEFETHTLDNGYKVRELRVQQSKSVTEFREKFIEKLSKYKEHFFKYKWLEFCRKFDIASLEPWDIYIQTDYSAQPVLEAQDKLNSQGHGVCVLSCWVVLHSPQMVEYTDDEGVLRSMRYYECDHIRVVSPSKGKGKDQDWYLHCTIFDFLISHYKRIIPNLLRVIVWTDGAPTQYKCRQNFFHVGQSFRKHGVIIIHRFGATAQFKGVHDKVGQVAKCAVG